MKIVADENMPGLAFPPGVTLVRVPGRTLCRAQLLDAEALLVRSVTRVDAALLQGTPVRFVGSATIGTDHLDLGWLAEQGIAVAHAPGCNARAVAEYVLGATVDWLRARAHDGVGLRIGIVGLGNVGRDVAQLADAFGMTVLPCDPPRQAAGETAPWPWVSLDEALAADVVTCHVPLVRGGPHPTFHLLDERRLAALRAGQLLINTARGAVVDNAALAARLRQPAAPDVVLDVWEGEPAVPPSLFRLVWRGTPHIAGYSQEGKLRGSAMVLAALARWSGLGLDATAVQPPAGEWSRPVRTLAEVQDLLHARYRLERDHRALADALNGHDPVGMFDELRKTYPARHEMAGMKVAAAVADRWRALLSRLGVAVPAGDRS